MHGGEGCRHAPVHVAPQCFSGGGVDGDGVLGPAASAGGHPLVHACGVVRVGREQLPAAALRVGHRELFEQDLGYEVLPRCLLCCSRTPDSAECLFPPARSFPAAGPLGHRSAQPDHGDDGVPGRARHGLHHHITGGGCGGVVGLRERATGLGSRRGPMVGASAVVSCWDSAACLPGSRTASALGCRELPVKPTAVASPCPRAAGEAPLFGSCGIPLAVVIGSSAAETLRPRTLSCPLSSTAVGPARTASAPRRQAMQPPRSGSRVRPARPQRVLPPRVAPGPAAAVVTIARPGGAVLGRFTAAGQDAGNAAQCRAGRNGSWSCATCTATARGCATCSRPARSTRLRPPRLRPVSGFACASRRSARVRPAEICCTPL